MTLNSTHALGVLIWAAMLLTVLFVALPTWPFGVAALALVALGPPVAFWQLRGPRPETISESIQKVLR